MCIACRCSQNDFSKWSTVGVGFYGLENLRLLLYILKVQNLERDIDFVWVQQCLSLSKVVSHISRIHCFFNVDVDIAYTFR
jgi:hypothetical protein